MDEGREGGRPGSPAGPVMPRTRLLVDMRFCEKSSSALAGSREVWSSCATMAGRVRECGAGRSEGVVMAKKRCEQD